MGKGEGKNQGEGNKEADRKFREAETKFVNSAEGKRKIAQAGNVSDEEARKLREAEEKGKARSKGEDPVVKNQSGGSASGRSAKGASKR
ncbi:MAG TPA: hypothetical protein VGP71_07660 [Burkholderiales bacterium]|jgi:hypothetical protein|nr:hypothetical protein [Burkholderiales bacterium]